VLVERHGVSSHVTRVSKTEHYPAARSREATQVNMVAGWGRIGRGGIQGKGAIVRGTCP